ncbi:hypothetical protein QQA02_01930 [Corynebacterium sp. MSK006]|nr:hypothetical protein [Corynebacterium sp. MSK006]
MRRVLRNLEKDYDKLREAIGLAQTYREKLPYKHYLEKCPSLDRDSMVVAIHELFSETGLGGLHLSASASFPMCLWFEDDDIVLMWRRSSGFRASQPVSRGQAPLIEAKARIVLFWEFPQPGADALSALSLQMFDNEDALEHARALSQRVPLSTNADEITAEKFSPTEADQEGFNFGS